MIRSQPPSARAAAEKSQPNLTWIKPAIASLPESSNRTGALKPTGLTKGGAPISEEIMREFLAAAAISAIIIGVMLGIG